MSLLVLSETLSKPFEYRCGLRPHRQDLPALDPVIGMGALYANFRLKGTDFMNSVMCGNPIPGQPRDHAHDSRLFGAEFHPIRRVQVPYALQRLNRLVPQGTKKQRVLCRCLLVPGGCGRTHIHTLLASTTKSPPYRPPIALESVAINLSGSRGLARWPFMPLSMALSTSSLKALAVMANMGTEVASGRSRPRMASVAS